MAKTDNTAMALPTSFLTAPEIPAHLRAAEDAGRGSENVSASDQMIPRLKLLQALNPEVTPGSAKYNENVRQGQWFNTLSNSAANAVFAVNLSFKKTFDVWKQRKYGGGKFGSYDSAEAAAAALQAGVAAGTVSDVNQYDVVENHQHLLLLLDEQGNIETPIIADWASTKAAISKQWNSMIAAQGGARFAGVWKLSSVSETNTKGAYFKPQVSFAGWAGEDLYAKIKEYADQFGV